MAADILLYNTHLVPVGKDQMQHMELARDIAIRFNGIYNDTFVVPEAYFGTEGSKVMSLQEPEKKMSKSDENPNNVILLSDDPAVIVKKVKKAVTDSGSEIYYSEDKPGISNLLSIYSAVTGKTVKECEAEFSNSGYGHFKKTVGEAVAEAVEPIQKRVKELSDDRGYIDNIIKENAEKANEIARKTIKKVYERIGFITVN
jgi:tryptophanyl-tRNA synthetase